MLYLTLAKDNDLTSIAALEEVPEVSEYIVANTLEEHQKNMQDSKLIYMKIMKDQQFMGFAILGLDDDGKSIELRRIAVADRCHGNGQEALRLIEKYGANTLGRTRIWLDVFSENTVAQHVYEKLGYQPYGTYEIDSKPLTLYHKELSTDISGVAKNAYIRRT